MDISIVIPCLNEEETIEACVAEALSAITTSAVSGEVIVSDNGSTDRSVELVRALGARIVHAPERGYGAALLAGISAAQGSYILMGDADGSYNFGELPKFLSELEQGNDLVMGCRLPSGGGSIEPEAMPFLHRWLGNPVLSFLGRLFFRIPVTDFHCGLRAFRRDSILELKLRTPGMEFASEMVVKAALQNLSISQVPITLRKDKRSRPPHLRTWRDGWRHLRFLLLYSPRWLFLYPGIALILLSGIAFIRLSISPLVIGSITFDTNTLLVSSSGLLIGFQLVLFSLFTEVFARTSGLLPEKQWTRKILASNTFETGIILGILLFGAGFLYLVWALAQWAQVGFGNLSYPDSLRIVIPSVTALCLGIQVAFGGFVVAVLGLKHDLDEKR